MMQHPEVVVIDEEKEDPLLIEIAVEPHVVKTRQAVARAGGIEPSRPKARAKGKVKAKGKARPTAAPVRPPQAAAFVRRQRVAHLRRERRVAEQYEETLARARREEQRRQQKPTDELESVRGDFEQYLVDPHFQNHVLSPKLDSSRSRSTYSLSIVRSIDCQYQVAPSQSTR